MSVICLKWYFPRFFYFRKRRHRQPRQGSAIRDRPIPSTTSEIRGFVNAASYLRSLIRDFSKLAGPLIEQSTGPKNAPVVLTSDSRESWSKIRDALSSTPVIKCFHWRLPVVLITDASQKFISSALLHPRMSTNTKHSTLHPVAYYSRKLNETQQRYSAQERELLAILLSLQHWCHWVKAQT